MFFMKYLLVNVDRDAGNYCRFVNICQKSNLMGDIIILRCFPLPTLKSVNSTLSILANSETLMTKLILAITVRKLASIFSLPSSN